MFYLFFSLSTASAVKTFLHYIPTQLRILQGFTYGEILTINTSSQKSQPLTLFFLAQQTYLQYIGPNIWIGNYSEQL